MIRCDPAFLFSYLPIHRRPAAGKSPDGRSSFATGETRLNNTKKTENRAKIAGVVKLHKKQAESLEAATFVGQNRTENVFRRENSPRRR